MCGEKEKGGGAEEEVEGRRGDNQKEGEEQVMPKMWEALVVQPKRAILLSEMWV